METERLFARRMVEDGYLLTHENCLDGAGSVINWLIAGGDRDRVRCCPAGKVDEWYEKNWQKIEGRPLLICDLAPSHVKTWEDLRTRKGQAYVLDHHASSEKFSERFSDIFLHSKNTKCGTKMMEEFTLYSTEQLAISEMFCSIDKLTNAIDRHDRWLPEKTQHDDEWAMLMRLEGFDEFIDHRICKGYDRWDFETQLLTYEKRRLDDKMERILKNVRKVQACRDVGDTNVYGCVVVSDDVSRVLNKMLEMHSDVDVALGISNEDGSVSLRSRKDGPDCSVIASRFSGGGHRNAAGFKLNPQYLTEFLLEIF